MSGVGRTRTLATAARSRRLQLRRRTGRLPPATRRGGDGRGQALVLRAVPAARDGDPDALRFLYLRYADNVYSYVCSIMRDEHEAEDVTQGIFARLPAALQRYRPQVVPFSSWIMRVAHNAAIDSVRAHARSRARRSATRTPWLTMEPGTASKRFAPRWPPCRRSSARCSSSASSAA